MTSKQLARDADHLGVALFWVGTLGVFAMLAFHYFA